MAKYKLGEMKKKANTYEDYTDSFIEGSVISDNKSEVTESELQEWFSNPEDNYMDIIKNMTYMYLTDGSIYQLYTMFKTLPKLNYKIKVFDRKMQGYEENLINCEKALYQVRYKTLTRDIIGQLCLTGSVICTWLGNKKTPYLYMFDNNEYVFSGYRRNGEWVAQIDLTWIEDMEELERERMFETFKEIKLKSAFEKYSNGSEEDKYLELPQERTCVIKINNIYRNQRIGLPLGIQALHDINHKKELRALETNIINKIIKSIAVLSIGNKDTPYKEIGDAMRKKIISSVQTTIKKAEKASGLPVTIMPDYAKLEFPEIDGTDIFKDGSDKFTEVNNSIHRSLGLAEEGSNYQSTKLNLDIIHSRIGVILEEIQQVFQKLFLIVLSKKVSENFAFEFITGTPLSNKEEIEILQKLHAEGTSYKSIVDMLSSTSYLELLNDSMREIEDMDVRNLITPPKTSSTLSADDGESGRPSVENPESEETAKSQETGGNLVDGSTE